MLQTAKLVVPIMSVAFVIQDTLTLLAIAMQTVQAIATLAIPTPQIAGPASQGTLSYPINVFLAILLDVATAYLQTFVSLACLIMSF